ncbi:hypothetical protein [Clostridium saccharoperbutylacetonicum]|uniref:hypothetical protein n=1 Tax=Clostridium saccharoperbutylacetonicum TaxID=36745 RepID=UPI0039E7C7CC
MKKISYFNRLLKEDIDITKEITDDSYEIKPLTIEIDDSQLDYYLNIINKSYAEFGKVKTEDIKVIASPTIEERLQSLENALSALMGV